VSIKQVEARWIASSHRGMYLYFSDRRPRVAQPLLWLVFKVRAMLKLGRLWFKGEAYTHVR
jgi:hypothetical protein